MRCLKDAEEHGISKSELEVACGQNLVKCMCDGSCVMRPRLIHLINPKTDSLTTRPLYMNRALYSPSPVPFPEVLEEVHRGDGKPRCNRGKDGLAPLNAQKVYTRDLRLPKELSWTGSL
jgi:hypothetical protein